MTSNTFHPQTHLSLTIPSAAKSHTGNYQCVVKTIYNDRPNLPLPVIESTITLVKVTGMCLICGNTIHVYNDRPVPVTESTITSSESDWYVFNMW